MLKFFLFLIPALSILADGGITESSYPYISGYTWWHFSDWKLTRPDYGKDTYSQFNPEEVKLGDTVFVEYDCLEEFARDYLPKLQTKVILITANYGYHADMPLPGPYAFLLNDERIAAWFVQNIDRLPSEKLIPMPIGLASNYWPHGNNQLLDAIIPVAKKNKYRPFFIYLNFSLSPERQLSADYFQRNGIVLQPRKSYASYLRDLSQTVFVISPPGGGIDCHRTWEALLLGCYPVVISNTLNPLYEELPVVIVPNWETVTREFLEEELQELKSRSWEREKLYFPYWAQKVAKCQEALRGIPDSIQRKIIAHVRANSWKGAYYDILPRVIRMHQYKTFLEVGVALGGHAEEILKETDIQSYIGIDPYRCYDSEDSFQSDVLSYSSLEPQKNFDYLYQWVSGCRLRPFGDRCKIMRTTSSDAALNLEDESLDCIFIDGDHRYEAVMKDLIVLFPKLKPGHLMIGDDYTMLPVKQAVDDFFAKEEKKLFFFTSQSGYRLWAVYK